MSRLDRLSDEFRAALEAAFEDHDRFGDIDSGDMRENGAMRVVGVARNDTIRFAADLFETYGTSLKTGNDCPECGRELLADGDCPEGHDFVHHDDDPDAARLETLLVVVEFSIAVGVHLERKRQEAARG